VSPPTKDTIVMDRKSFAGIAVAFALASGWSSTGALAQ
jgi:hypothetical protein